MCMRTHAASLGRMFTGIVRERGRVAGLDGTGFAVALIPHTLTETTLGALGAGDTVNLEVDVLAKYVERLLPSTMSR